MYGFQSECCGHVQQGLEDPFKGRTAAARVARDGYLHMWDVLVREAAAAELLFDSHLLEKLTNLVIALNWCAWVLSRLPDRALMVHTCVPMQAGIW